MISGGLRGQTKGVFGTMLGSSVVDSVIPHWPECAFPPASAVGALI